MSIYTVFALDSSYTWYTTKHMTNHKFTQKEVFTSAWNKVRDNAWFLFTVYFMAAALLSSLSFNALAQFLFQTGINGNVIGVAQIILKLVTYYAVCIALFNVTLKIVSHGSASYSDLVTPFKTSRLSTTYTAASLMYTVFVGLVFAAIITTLSTLALGSVPGAELTTTSYLVISLATVVIIVVTYLVMRLQFFKLIIVENENTSPIKALKDSFDMTKGHSVALISFYAIMLILNVVGALAFGAGLIVTLPVSLLAFAIVYKKLSHNQ